jgi:hypothetical protein
MTAGNKSFPWQLHGWAPPNKNTTVGALGRAVGSVANSSNPLNATKAVAQGLALYKQQTKALILGQAGIVSFVNSVNTSASSGSPLKCFVDPSTGQLVGLEQAGLTACSPTGDVTVVPASAGYISQIKLAYTYDGAFVGRLVFDLKANATAAPVSYTCGSAGGKAVDLLPSKGDFVMTQLGVGCAPLPAAAVATGRRRRSLSAAAPGTGLSARGITVAAAALASLPIDPVTGVPQTPQLGDVLAPQGDPTPTPSPTTAFVTNFFGNDVTQCAISGASITSCAVPNGVTWNLNRSYGIAIANNIAYITKNGDNTVTQCAISGGSITSCAVPSGVTWNLNRPYEIAIANNIAYITNNFGNTVTQCAISGGSITSCAVPTGVTWNLNGPAGIAISNDVAYITNSNVNSVTQCAISGGSITSCAVPSVGSWNLNGPYGIAIRNDVAYIANALGNTITQCAISGGSITSCAVPTGVTWNMNGPTGIALI